MFILEPVAVCQKPQCRMLLIFHYKHLSNEAPNSIRACLGHGAFDLRLPEEGASPMSNLFLLDDQSWSAIESLIPTNRPGVKPGRYRQVISGTVHVLKVGCRWSDCPAAYGPSTTVYNRFYRWSKAGTWQKMADRLVVHDATDIQCIDSTTTKAHRFAVGGKGRRNSKESAGAEAGRPGKSTPSPTAMGV